MGKCQRSVISTVQDDRRIHGNAIYDSLPQRSIDKGVQEKFRILKPMKACGKAKGGHY